MKATLLLASFLWLALPVFGSQTSSETAAATVKGWLQNDRAPLGEPLGHRVENVETYKDGSGNVLYHVVYLKPSGFVIVSGEDLVEPIIAFASRGRFDPSLKNPLGALVSGDVPGRVARARATGITTPAGHFLTARNKWQQLQQASPDGSNAGSSPAFLVTATDIRVAPFVQTFWNQSTVNGMACYNYYTPPYAPGAPSNYVCGCVATAMAQLLYYFQYPTAGVGTNTYTDYIDGVATNLSLRGGDGAGGPYAWGNMPPNPSSPSDSQCQAIGALTYDCGVAANMDYFEGGVDESGASDYAAKTALLHTFMYGNAIYGQNYQPGFFGSNMVAMVNANMDARLPVAFSIQGEFGSASEGHEIVCDGYGYDFSTLYHHINMGWGGEDSAWYALPVIDTPDGYAYCTNLDACIYNIYTNGSGEIISGRILDPSGAPVTNATVSATRTGGGSYAATTDTNGIYALVNLPSASQYSLTAAKTGFLSASAKYPTGKSSDFSSSGNVWGANFTLATPLEVNPETGFAAIGPTGGPFSGSIQTYILTNYGSAPLNWSLANTSAWLNASPASGTLTPGGPAAAVTISLNSTAASMGAGVYATTICLTNLNNNAGQSLQFTLSVMSGDYPISAAGYNADVVVENTATGGNTAGYAQPFDPSETWAFYESGLVAENLYGGMAVEGLPQSGTFTSAADNTTTFYIGPYASDNVLYLTPTNMSGTLTFNPPAAYNSLSVLAASANGGGNGSLVINFADGTSSPAISFNAQNYLTHYSAGTGAGLTGFGLIDCGYFDQFYTWDTSYLVPNLYHTKIDLASLNLNSKPVVSLTFTMAGGSTDTGVFALSGTPSPASAVWPEFLCATRTNGILTFKWCAAEGEAYQVQYKTNLTQTSWLNLGIPVTATNGIMPGSDALTNSQRFYRILLEQ